MGAPELIILLRHGEKPNGDDDDHLSDRGRLRAAALAVDLPQRFGTIHHIFATAPSKHSVRPIETVSPLSDAIGVPIDKRFLVNQIDALAGEIRSGAYADSRIVICWHHESLQALARALGATGAGVWGDVYDRLWLLRAATDGLEDGPQRLLFGDSDG